jgi:hypothetical protein
MEDLQAVGLDVEKSLIAGKNFSKRAGGRQSQTRFSIGFYFPD